VFVSSRRRHTRSYGDWSSDVCSSDLAPRRRGTLPGLEVPMRIETLLVHAGEPQPRIERAVAMPVFQSSTFVEARETGYHDVGYEIGRASCRVMVWGCVLGGGR